MKKYNLTIVYDDTKEEVDSIEQKVTNLEITSKEIDVVMNSQFVDCLSSLDQNTKNILFQAVDDAGAMMGDA
tara:strand:+ start:529 stop:744 length:216 start_codon:yes stop_codon:yes gene_type:complete